jgi:cell division protein FtsI (penicillin-binding protein 3)
MMRNSAPLSLKNRRRLVIGLLALATVGILARAVYLQVVHKDFLQDQGDERYLRVMEIPAYRGMIVDRNGEPLAVSSPVDSVWANPIVLLQHRDRLATLAQTLGMKQGQVERQLQGRADKEFAYLRRHLTPDIAQQVMELHIPGVYLQREYRRYYPTAEVASHLLGFTNIDDVGQEGLELAFNDRLQGKPGSKRVLKDRYGHIVENVESIRLPEPGQSLVLSIDRRIQYLAYRSLKTAVQQHGAAGGSAVVLDVETGEILAMVNQPAANPNDRQQRQNALLRNRAVTDVYEPGSTLKPFTIAMALESGAYRPTTLINTNPGYLRVGRNRVRDMHNYGLIDVARVISKSSNVGASKIALSLPAEHLWSLYKRLGFGSSPRLGFPGEQNGVLRHFSQWSAIGHANHSFGYGLSVTTLQLAHAYAVLAADGVKRPLSLLRLEQPPAEGERILSAKTARQVRTMMEAVVSTQGTAPKAAVLGYRVAGKTGTAHKAFDGRYAGNRYFSLFAGMAPAEHPRLVMAVMVDDPRKQGHYGGQVAAPVFSAVMSGALRLLNVTPDEVPAVNLAVATPVESKP